MPAATANPAVSLRSRIDTVRNILVDGEWRASKSLETFKAIDPRTRKPLPEVYPISGWSDIDSALTAAATAAAELRANALYNEQSVKCDRRSI